MADWSEAPAPSTPVKRILFSTLMDLSVVARDEAPHRRARRHLRVVSAPVPAGSVTAPAPGQVAAARRRIGGVAVLEELPPCCSDQPVPWRTKFADTFRRLAFDVVYFGIPVTRSPAEELAVHLALRIGRRRVHPALLREWRNLDSALIPDGTILLHYDHLTESSVAIGRAPNETLPPEQWFREYKPRYPVMIPDRTVAESSGEYEAGTPLFRST